MFSAASYSHCCSSDLLVDFNLTTALTFSAAGELCDNLTILDDNVLEGDQMFTVAIESTSISIITIDSPSSVDVTIEDNESACMFVYAAVIVASLHSIS